jgi:hypothetical protein
MKYRTRIRYTETDKALMWERWREGESLQRIAQLFDLTIPRLAASCREPGVYGLRHAVARFWR